MAFLCDVCGNNFTRSDNLNQHKIFVHENGQKFPCNIYKQEFSQNSVLMKHQRKVINLAESQVNLLKKCKCELVFFNCSSFVSSWFLFLFHGK